MFNRCTYRIVRVTFVGGVLLVIKCIYLFDVHRQLENMERVSKDVNIYFLRLNLTFRIKFVDWLVLFKKKFVRK